MILYRLQLLRNNNNAMLFRDVQIFVVNIQDVQGSLINSVGHSQHVQVAATKSTPSTYYNLEATRRDKDVRALSARPSQCEQQTWLKMRTKPITKPLRLYTRVYSGLVIRNTHESHGGDPA